MTNEYSPDGKEIRFIDSHYKDLFHIPDGSCVQIHYQDETVVKPCTFIDEYHTQIGYNVFHICQFAEQMERCHNTVLPLDTMENFTRNTRSRPKDRGDAR